MLLYVAWMFGLLGSRSGFLKFYGGPKTATRAHTNFFRPLAGVRQARLTTPWRGSEFRVPRRSFQRRRLSMYWFFAGVAFLDGVGVLE